MGVINLAALYVCDDAVWKKKWGNWLFLFDRWYLDNWNKESLSNQLANLTVMHLQPRLVYDMSLLTGVDKLLGRDAG